MRGFAGGIGGGIAGCGKAKLDTPEACLKAFDAAMRRGDIAKATQLVALDKWAADNATDWNSYAPSQRDLILGRMREEFGQKLEAIRQTYLQANYQAGAAQIQGEWATLPLTGGGSALPVILYFNGNEWRIYSLGDLRVGMGE